MTDLLPDLLSLPFQMEIFTELMSTPSSLLILAKGLVPFRLVQAMAPVYATDRLLVLLLNLEEDEEADLSQQRLCVIKADTLAEQRGEIYLRGGLISITSRILLTDMLRGRLPIHLVTGVTEFGLEAFIIDLLRSQNKGAFVKALSDCPEAFVGGIGKVERMLKYLKVDNLLLYPRFHTTIKDQLDHCGVNVIEIAVKATAKTRIIQLALYELIERCLNELKRINKAIDPDECTVDLVITDAFGLLIHRQLEPIWHQVGAKTRQLVQDIRTLRTLLMGLFQEDPVRFLHSLESVLFAEGSSESYWMHLEAAEVLLCTAKERVFANPSNSFAPEIPAKWQALQELLRETDSSAATLIMVNGEGVKAQLEGFLAHGAISSMRWGSFARYQRWKAHVSTDQQQQQRQLTGRARWIPHRRKRTEEEEAPATELIETGEENTQIDSISIRTYSKNDTFSWLGECQPRHLILYDTQLAMIRQIELYQAIHAVENLTVHMLVHQETVEEQLLLLAIREEKRSFETLIKAKATMTMPTYHHEHESPADMEAFARFGGRKPLNEEETEDGGISKKIIVDVRELRSSLPYVLYRTGWFQLEPATIAIGDYLLSPEICVERKSVADLIGSLNSGRLYTQVSAMVRVYEVPVLLIEFDRDRPFSLISPGELRPDISVNDVMSKLILLILHFPQLRIIWSPNLQATANIFHDLKRTRKDPILLEDEDGAGIPATNQSGRVVNPKIKEWLLRFPGINEQNVVGGVMTQFRNLRDLADAPQERLEELLGRENGGKLWRFINLPPSQND